MTEYCLSMQNNLRLSLCVITDPGGVIMFTSSINTAKITNVMGISKLFGA